MFGMIDLYSRYFVVWNFPNTMTVEWVVKAINTAIEKNGT